jgi:adenylate cyclase
MESYNISKHLRKEILLSEKLRAQLLAVVSIGAIIILFVLKAFFEVDLLLQSLDATYIYIIQIIFLIFFFREYIVIRIINNRLAKDKDVSDIFRYTTSFIEISIPSLILFTIGLFLESTLVLNSPAIFFYFIIIILSTLSLEFKISVSIGIVGAVEYVVIAYILTEQFGTAIGSEVYNSLIFHIGKSNLIIVCGVIAGYVAEQIKKKINNVSNSLVERNKVINMFGQQISSSIVEYLIENDNKIISERKYVCVMFLDIRDFSQLAESMQPEEIIKFQNDVFGFMIEIINNHHGIINQFLGDGYMATFGAPLSSGNDSQNAVNAAIEITEELKRRNNNAEFPRTNIGIGLHSGYVVAGNVGTDIRKQYSISGNTVILASRIEQLNKKYNSQILISKEVLDNVNISNEIVSHGKVEIKGREEPIEIFQIN